jgi:glutamate-1-semialdehyde 2,1-aminomutase
MGAYGGRKDLMNLVSPAGPVYQAGTLSGSPVAMAAGLAVLGALRQRGYYERLQDRTGYWTMGLKPLLTPGRVVLNSVGGLFTLFFHKTAVTDFASANAADQDMYARFFHRLLGRGVYFPPSAFEAGFISSSHSKAQLKTALRAVEQALTDLHA